MPLVAALTLTTTTRARAGGWLYSRTLTIDNTGGVAKSDYPVKVTLTSNEFDFAKAQAGGEDVRFHQAGVRAPHWIEAWDATAQTAVIWVNVPTVPADSTTELTMRYGNADAADGSDGHAVFTAFAAYPDEGVLYGQPGESNAMLLAGVTVAATGGDGWRAGRVREHSNVWHDPDDAGREYKMLVTGVNETADAFSLGLYYASDPLGPWTEHDANPVVNNAEDPYVVRGPDGTLHMYCESYRPGFFGRKIDHYTSEDGVTWTLDGVAVEQGGSGAWDEHLVGSPLVRVVDGVFHMLYEGISSGAATIATGYATSLDGSTWTKGSQNPIGKPDVIDDFVVIDGVGYYTGHDDGARRVNRLYTGPTDPAEWETATLTEVPWASPFGNDDGDSTMFVEGDPGLAAVQPNDGSTVVMARFAGGASIVPHVDFLAPDPHDYQFGVTDGVLAFKPGAAGVNTHLGLRSSVTFGPGVVVGVKKRMTDATNTNRRYFSTVIGTGSIATVAFNHVPRLTDCIIFLNDAAPGTAGSALIRRGTGDTVNDLASGTISANEATAFAVHELVWLPGGQFEYVLDGASKASATDATFADGEKMLLLAQGLNSSGVTTESEVEWVYVRKYDGEMPTVTVGAET